MATIRLTAGKSDILELAFTGSQEHQARVRFVICENAPTDLIIQIRKLDEANLNLSVQDRINAVTALVQGKNWGVTARNNPYTMPGRK